MFNAFRSDGVPFSTTFQYGHTFQNGQRVVGTIHDLANGMYTRKDYDLLGRLASERVDLQKPNGPGTDRYESRTYAYAADGRAILKNAELRLSSSGPGTMPLSPPTAATGSGSSRYIVQNGDSLFDIALANYGDSALWYVVADANGIVGDPGESLPSTEVGKAYEIPDAVRSSQTANTFTPFGMADIVGDDRPIAIRHRPRPSKATWSSSRSPLFRSRSRSAPRSGCRRSASRCRSAPPLARASAAWRVRHPAGSWACRRRASTGGTWAFRLPKATFSR